MKYRLSLLCLLLVFAIFVAIQPSQVSAAGSAATVTEGQDNPLKASPDVMAKAKKLYTYDCAMCHNENGDGKGDLASDFKNKPKDWTDPATLKAYTDTQLFSIIKDGKDEMPPEGKRAKTDDVWGLVHYIRSLSKKG